MTRTELYKELRRQGLTYREIAQRCGVTYQAVAQACAKSSIAQFRLIKPESCVYPGLRKWMNDHCVSRSELYRRLREAPCIGHAPSVIADRMTGRTLWRMDEIDRLLEITGMTYEQLFWRDRHGDSENGLDGSGPVEQGAAVEDC